MAIKIKNFEFSEDFLTKSSEEFKAHMKRVYKLKVKEVRELYDLLHGNDSPVSEKLTKDSE